MCSTLFERLIIHQDCPTHNGDTDALQQKLTDANAQLRKGITRLREAAHARNQQIAGHERTVAALKKQLGEKDSKIQQFEEFKRKAQISLRTLTRERDQARAAKSELEEKLQAQSETLEVVTAVSLFSLCFGRNILTLAIVRCRRETNTRQRCKLIKRRQKNTRRRWNVTR